MSAVGTVLAKGGSVKDAEFADAKDKAPDLIAYRGDELLDLDFPARRPILTRSGQSFLAAGDIGEIFATRGVGKTWFLMTVALMVSNGKAAMGFDVPERRRVLYVDGEMARQDIQDRFKLLCERTGLTLTEELVIVAADWQDEFMPRIDTPTGQFALEPFVEAADLVILDNRSCLFDPEGEKDPSAWQPAQEYLLSLRRRGKCVAIAHHANRQGGARGLGKPEDVMNLVMKLRQPEGYVAADGARFVCDLTPPDGKARGIWGPAAIPFGVRLTDKGWVLDTNGQNSGDAGVRQQIIEYLEAADAADDRPKSANSALRKVGGNRKQGLHVWGKMHKAGEIVGDKKTGFKVGVLQTVPF